MTINNITGSNSLRSNCEPDSSASILSNIHEFILDRDKEEFVDMDTDDLVVYNPMYESGSDEETYGVKDFIVYNSDSSDVEMDLANSKVISKINDVNELIVFDPEFEDVQLNFFEESYFSQSSSVICQKLKKLTKFSLCDGCKTSFITDESILMLHCKKVLCFLFDVIPHLCLEMNLKKKLLAKISLLATIGCPDHELEIDQKIKELCVDHTINSFIHNINQFLSGKIDILPEKCNIIQKLAFAKYDQRRKKKKIGKHSDLFDS